MKSDYTANLNADVMRELDEINKPEPKRAQSCPTCDSAYWKLMKRDKVYECRKCGYTQQENPYV